jgi:hypothetical protein
MPIVAINGGAAAVNRPDERDSWLGRVVHFIVSGREHMRARRRYRVGEHALHSLPDYMLTDIRMTREDLAFARSSWPSDLLLDSSSSGDHGGRYSSRRRSGGRPRNAEQAE